MSKGSKFRQLMMLTDSFIKFADTNVKSICVAHWDGNGDGEIGYSEAKVATTLGTYFANNTNITSFDELQYFKNITSLGNSALVNSPFQGCTKLVSIDFSNINTIGAAAFKGCSSMVKIDCKDTVNLYLNSFSDCVALEEVRITKVAYIAQGAFSNCNAITKIIIGSVLQWCKMSIWDNSGAMGIQATSSPQAGGKASLYLDDAQDVSITNIVVPDSVTSIRSQCFLAFKSLESVTLHEGITSLGYMAFYTCQLAQPLELKKLSNLKTISAKCFYLYKGGIDGLPESITSIGQEAFRLCVFSSNTELTLPLITSLGMGAFNASNIISFDAENLKSMVDGDSGKVGVFQSCTSLKTVSLPSLTRVAANAFMDCSSLSNVTLGESLTSFGGACFSGTNVTKVKLPSTTMATITVNSYGSYLVFPAGCHIYVPTEELMAEYQADTNWSKTSYNWHLISEWTD